MPSVINYHFTNSASDIRQILDLQQKNLAKNISPAEAIEQGFVTVEHSFEVLMQMCRANPSLVAKAGDQVIGYALVMTKEFANKIPVLLPMFELFDSIEFNNLKISNYSYFVMGQVCIDKMYRGMGIFNSMYNKLKESLAAKFDIMLTEVAERNTRSLIAHQRFGMQTIHTYNEGGETWHILLIEL